MTLKPFKAPEKTASPAQRELMGRFSPDRPAWRSVAIPQLGLNLGFDASGGKTPAPPGDSIQTFSGNELVTFTGIPIVTFA